ncbi:hypothetical protein CA13_10520 [Planctomycetes bacterium CA13]|uniref:Uncharacterized protein n=1 Tax=Novipirellula herctigrandis TaxID=2527986 RepID=A0A5C5YYJ7_9BACT|nr:hypothetical protein CA13_10520 [Planctomycetes bacterium CA13]
MFQLNPYEPPVHQACEPDASPEQRATRLPAELVTSTKRGMRVLSILALGLPLLFSPIVDGFRINPFSIMPLAAALTMDNRSFFRFPWTAIACLTFVLGFLGDCEEHTVSDIMNWLPSRDSPLLGVRFLCAASGIYTAWMVWQCHRHHRVNQTTT